jgi:hypothetical protein
MGKSYNVVLNSEMSTLTTVGETFNIDWGFLPNGPYKVSFCFNSAIATLTNGVIAAIYVDIGQGRTTKIACNSSSNAVGYRNNYLGTLFYTGTGASNNLYADTHTNVPIYIENRPTNNTVFVQIHTSSIDQTTNYTPAPGAYILTLNFEEC